VPGPTDEERALAGDDLALKKTVEAVKKTFSSAMST
jgi:hypothetical protein